MSSTKSWLTRGTLQNMKWKRNNHESLYKLRGKSMKQMLKIDKWTLWPDGGATLVVIFQFGPKWLTAEPHWHHGYEQVLQYCRVAAVSEDVITWLYTSVRWLWLWLESNWWLLGFVLGTIMAQKEVTEAESGRWSLETCICQNTS